jgi:hypothetical protein
MAQAAAAAEVRSLLGEQALDAQEGQGRAREWLCWIDGYAVGWEMSDWMDTVKAGDRIWVGGRHYKHSEGLLTVRRVTATMIVGFMPSSPNYARRFWRGTRYEVGGRWDAKHLESVASATEVQEWEASEAQKAAKRESEYTEQVRLKQLEGELEQCFPPTRYANVQSERNNAAGQFRVTIYAQDENDVRLIAAKLSAV